MWRAINQPEAGCKSRKKTLMKHRVVGGPRSKPKRKMAFNKKNGLAKFAHAITKFRLRPDLTNTEYLIRHGYRYYLTSIFNADMLEIAQEL